MVNYINAAIFGIIQSVTEFLPISSTGHLIILHKFLELPIKNKLIFDVTLHLATFLAIFWFFRNEVFKLIGSWLDSFKGGSKEKGRLFNLIIIGTIPAAIAGYFFEDTVENILRSPLIVAVTLFLFGMFFIIAEKMSSKTDELNNLNLKKTVFIGLAQAISLIPGTSRSGITIIAGLGVGLKREAAARFSFLLSLPIIFGAFIKKVPQIVGTDFEVGGLPVILVAFIFSFFSAILTIKYFLKFLRNNSLIIFAIYRFILGGVIITILFYSN